MVESNRNVVYSLSTSQKSGTDYLGGVWSGVAQASISRRKVLGLTLFFSLPPRTERHNQRRRRSRPQRRQLFMASHSHPSSTANIVGIHYRVGRKIGEGSFGVIFEGICPVSVSTYLGSSNNGSQERTYSILRLSLSSLCVPHYSRCKRTQAATAVTFGLILRRRAISRNQGRQKHLSFGMSVGRIVFWRAVVRLHSASGALAR